MRVRICGWSGPRNVSTALMRSFEARGDCSVVDEPLYAAFLARTGKDHPGRAEILASQPTPLSAALAALRAPATDPAYVYEKHMAHHLPPDWAPADLGVARHLLLIRDPVRVVASYAKVREHPLPEDLGYDRLVELHERLRDDRGRAPVVVDGDDLLGDPPRVLAAICGALGIPPTDRMLRWPAGKRVTDGVWAPHWYAAVEASTGFEPPRPPHPLPDTLREVVAAVNDAYVRLAAVRLR